MHAVWHANVDMQTLHCGDKAESLYRSPLFPEVFI